LVTSVAIQGNNYDVLWATTRNTWGPLEAT